MTCRLLLCRWLLAVAVSVGPLLVTVPLLGQTTAPQEASSETPKLPDRSTAVAPNERIRLFDGTLDQFDIWLKDTKRQDPRKVFRVTEQLLHITGDGLGGLVTKESYRDYHLVLEYRWGDKTWKNRKTRSRDSGLLIHSLGPMGGYNGTWMHSIEVQIIEGGVGDFILVAGKDEKNRPLPISLTCETARDRDGEVIWKKGGKRKVFNLRNRRRINWYGRDPDWKDVLGFRGRHDVESPGKLWTRLDVMCDGGHVEVFVNGKKVNEGFDAVPSFGKLQLQTELAEIFVRKWELWPIGKGPKPAAAVQDGS